MNHIKYFTKTWLVLISALALSGGAFSQTASWCTNSCIAGTDNSAFGAGSLGSAANPSAENTAVGKDAVGSLLIGLRNTGVGFESLFNTASVAFNGGNDNTAIGHRSLYTNLSGEQNTAAGNNSLYSNTSGNRNAASGMSSLYSNTTGSDNVAMGHSALYSNIDGADNVGLGFQSAFSNVSGNQNTAIGKDAYYYLTFGEQNTAVGCKAMQGSFVSDYASYNTGVGHSALYSITTGNYNTAMGTEALYTTQNGWYNVGIGSGAAHDNWDGRMNVAVGVSALYENQSGLANTAIGTNAMWENQGDENTAVGTSALYWNTAGRDNTAIGSAALMVNAISFQNTALGAYADMTGQFTNGTAVGYFARVNASNKVRIGNTAVTVIEGQVAPSWPSDGRFKFDISEEDVKGLEFITKLRPVVYNFDTRKFTEYIHQNDPEETRKKVLEQDFAPSTNIRQSGFIAQEVEKAAEEVGYDFNGIIKPEGENGHYSLAYSEFVVPLVKAVQEQQKLIEELQAKLEGCAAQSDLGKTGESNVIPVVLDDVEGIVLNQNIPNPFAESTVIRYDLNTDFSRAQILITHVDGRIIKTVDIQQKGPGQLNVFANDLSSGIYTYTLVVDGKTIDTKSMVKN